MHKMEITVSRRYLLRLKISRGPSVTWVKTFIWSMINRPNLKMTQRNSCSKSKWN